MLNIIILSLTVCFIISTTEAKEIKIKERAITSLIIGINSTNTGLRASAAHMLGEVKSHKAVIPLMRMLKTEKQENVRIVAALALYKIGDERGIFAIKQAVKFDRSEKVRRFCSIFYNLHTRKTSKDELLIDN